jgi:hypothetical protein
MRPSLERTELPRSLRPSAQRPHGPCCVAQGRQRLASNQDPCCVAPRSQAVPCMGTAALVMSRRGVHEPATPALSDSLSNLGNIRIIDRRKRTWGCPAASLILGLARVSGRAEQDQAPKGYHSRPPRSRAGMKRTQLRRPCRLSGSSAVASPAPRLSPLRLIDCRLSDPQLSPLGLRSCRFSGSAAIAPRAPQLFLSSSAAIASQAPRLSPLGLISCRLSGSSAVASPAPQLSPLVLIN